MASINYPSRIIKVHRENVGWYLAQADTPETPFEMPVCNTEDELRWMLGHFDFAVNGKTTWINQWGMVES
jgi:hypothetical protein